MTQTVKKVFVLKATLQTQQAAVADNRMKSLPIIDRFDEMLDRS